MPAVFDLAPKVKQSKRSDGFYGWHMHGPLSRADFEPAPLAGGFPPGAAAPAAKPVAP